MNYRGRPIAQAMVAACLWTSLAYAASPGGQAVMEGAAFVQAFTRQVKDYYDRQIKPLDRERTRLKREM